MSNTVKRPTPFTFVPLDGKPSKAGYTIEDADAYMDRVEAENKRLREALEKIAKKEGRFDRDPLIHASNAVDDMAAIADAALSDTEATDE